MSDPTQTEDEERIEWLKLSERALIQTWENPSDDVFNELAEGSP